jgi:FkbM family methyltransferase
MIGSLIIKTMSDQLKRNIQSWGSSFSRFVFTEKNLELALVRWLYLRLYSAFKWLFEKSEMQTILELVRPGSQVLDIGANVGWTASYFSKAVGPSGKVLAFEPDPVARSLGMQKSKNLKNVVWFPLALGETDGQVEFFQNLSNRADNRVYQDGNMMPFTKRIETRMSKLSTVANEHLELFGDVSFVKIDVQGAETSVIEGMKSWLAGLSKKPIIAFEWWPYGLSRAGSSPEKLKALLSEIGYETGDGLKDVTDHTKEKDWYSLVIVKPL